MTREDFEVLSTLAPSVNRLGRIGVFSPLKAFEGRLFPGAARLPRWRWDLNRPSTRRFDVLVAANVFMYAPDPARWFRNVMASCRWFLLLDLVRRRRSDGSEFGPDGDRMRYRVGGAEARTEDAFDLASLGDRLLAWRTFDGGANEHDEAPLHVVALVRGDLGEPVLRIDDYPTGVRPILDDLSPLHGILEEVDASGLAYHLGIVPALVREDMAAFLRGLRHMIPTAHGYDHCYPRYSPKLIAAGDPYNRNTVGVFNEFRGVPYDETVRRLTDGRKALSDLLGRDVRRYIPPCNLGDRRTGRALPEAGFHAYLSERRIPGCPLPWLKSDFYGRSPQFSPDDPGDVTTLHLTWEADLVREGDGHAVGRVLDGLTRRRRALRDTVRPLAERIGGHAGRPGDDVSGFSADALA